VRVVSTSALPIDLAGQVAAAVPGAVTLVPASGHVELAGLDLRDADALVCLLLDRIDAAVFARAPNLRVVANCAVGIDNIDLAAATAAGVYVTNTPDVLTEATAELAFALLLACARRLGEGERLVRSGAWTGWALDQLIGVGLLGKTLGIIGMGRIGQAMARRALGFGMHVIYADPHNASFRPEDLVSPHAGHEGSSIREAFISNPNAREGLPIAAGGANFRSSSVRDAKSPLSIDPPDATHGGVNRPALPKPKGEEFSGLEKELQAGAELSGPGPRDATRGGVNRPARPVERGREGPLSIDEVFATADAVTLHCPLTPETRHLVNDRRLAMMKPTAILVNTARGGCVDEAALIRALTGGRLFGAALDVYAQEPQINRDLLVCPRLILAPHIGSATAEARTAMAQLCADAVIAALRGHPPPNLVNNVSPSWSHRS
jgi:lactate dehydrogenase-like 2-hydroxyacid dehydrogenase